MSDFVVNDRRIFTQAGEVSEKERPEEPARKEAAAEAAKSESYQDPEGLPPANFTALLIGLATSAFIHMGEAAGPGEAPKDPDLPAAKHSIDLLAVLQLKTKGNLEEEEDALLTTLLYDLRLKYVKLTSKS